MIDKVTGEGVIPKPYEFEAHLEVRSRAPFARDLLGETRVPGVAAGGGMGWRGRRPEMEAGREY